MFYETLASTTSTSSQPHRNRRTFMKRAPPRWSVDLIQSLKVRHPKGPSGLLLCFSMKTDCLKQFTSRDGKPLYYNNYSQCITMAHFHSTKNVNLKCLLTSFHLRKPLFYKGIRIVEAVKMVN